MRPEAGKGSLRFCSRCPHSRRPASEETGLAFCAPKCTEVVDHEVSRSAFHTPRRSPPICSRCCVSTARYLRAVRPPRRLCTSAALSRRPSTSRCCSADGTRACPFPVAGFRNALFFHGLGSPPEFWASGATLDRACCHAWPVRLDRRCTCHVAVTDTRPLR